jgi:serine/threonine-protein kinase RsbW
VSSFASTSFGLEDDRIDDLKIAVSEACTNAIEAHDAADTDERVLIRCDDNEGHLEVRIEDRGRGFDPESLPEHPPVTDPTRLKFERGLGIPLIRSLVDDLDITSSHDGTQVRIVMRREDDDELLEED